MKKIKWLILSFLLILLFSSCWLFINPCSFATFDGNGEDGGEVPEPRENTGGFTIRIPGNPGELYKEGYTFSGWSESRDGSSEVYTEGYTLYFETEITLYAVWLKNVTLVFLPNEADSGGVPISVPALEADPFTVPYNEGLLVKEGYLFAGWNTQKDGSGTTYFPGDDIVIEVDKTDFYALWERPFRFRWEVTEGENSLRINGYSGLRKAKYTVDWGDGSEVTWLKGYNNDDHTYEEAGEYIVSIAGNMQAFKGTGEDLLEILDWGMFTFTEYRSSFYGCSRLIITAEDNPSFEEGYSLEGLFEGCSSLEEVPGIGTWDVSGVTDMGTLFKDCPLFNGDISRWDTSSVTDMSSLFEGAKSFNQPIGSWKTQNVSNMQSLFKGADSFNQPIGEWETSAVKDMSSMFQEAVSFNQPIADWKTSAVKDMSSMFQEAVSFNQPIGEWRTFRVKNMSSMFQEAASFNQPIADWNTLAVKDMSSMFQEAVSFNQPIADWKISSVKDMSSMFQEAVSFNQPIGQWKTYSAETMYSLFMGAEAFDQDISDWDVSSVMNFYSFLTGREKPYSTKNYEKLLIGWAQGPLQIGLVFEAGDSVCSSEEALEAKAKLLRAESQGGYDWIIDDGTYQ